MMVNNMQQMSMGGGAQLGGSNMATPHIQRQLDQAAVSRQSASPHHHARMMRSTTATSKDGEGLAGANGREPSRDPPNGTTVERQWTTLDVGGMAIRNISKELFRYTFLTTLYLNHNQITVIPPQIANLKNLVRLDASGNRLMSVPPELGLLSLLKELLLFDNQLTTLPPELGFLYQLDNLGLEGNPIQEPLLSLLQKDGTTGVISYLRDSCPGGFKTNDISLQGLISHYFVDLVPPNPPDREWIYLENDIPSQEAGELSTDMKQQTLSF
jgi:CCR4-NOT transcription complex subunit 6